MLRRLRMQQGRPECAMLALRAPGPVRRGGEMVVAARLLGAVEAQPVVS